MAGWQPKKLEALSSDREHIYESESRILVVHVVPERHPNEIRLEFARRKDERYSASQKRQTT